MFAFFCFFGFAGCKNNLTQDQCFDLWVNGRDYLLNYSGEYYSCLNSTYLKNDIIESKSNEIESKQDKNITHLILH